MKKLFLALSVLVIATASAQQPQIPGVSAIKYAIKEDYVKLKMMDFLVHKDALKDLLKKSGK